MERQNVLNSKVLKGFIKGSLVVVGLFVVFYCGVAAVLLFHGYNFVNAKPAGNELVDNKPLCDNKPVNDKSLDNKSLCDNKPLDNKPVCDNKSVCDNKPVCDSVKCKAFILILVGIPLIAFFGFIYFVKPHCNNLFVSLGIKCEGTLLKMHKIEVPSEACLMVAKAIKPNSEKDAEALQKLLNDSEMIILFTKLNGCC